MRWSREPTSPVSGRWCWPSSATATEWLTLSLATEPNDINIRYNATCTYSQLGELDRAIDVLEAWIPQVGVEMQLWFMHDSDLDPIREHPVLQD